MKKIGRFIFLLLFTSCSTSNDNLELLPGTGIILRNDTIPLESSSPKTVTDLLNIKDTADNTGVHWSGFDSEGNDVYGYYEKETVKFKGIEFEFTGPTIDSLTLKCIYINPEKSPFDISFNKLNLRQKAEEILKKFPNSYQSDITGITSSEFGILFQTDTIDNKPKIQLLSINSK